MKRRVYRRRSMWAAKPMQTFRVTKVYGPNGGNPLLAFNLGDLFTIAGVKKLPRRRFHG